MWPVMIAAIDTTPNVSKPMMPSTIDVTASPLVLDCTYWTGGCPT